MSSPYPGTPSSASGPYQQPPAPGPTQPPGGPQQQLTYPPAYRPGGFAPSPADWGSMNAATAPPPNTTGPIEQVWAGGQRVSNRPILNLVAIAVGALAMIVVLVIVMQQTGVGPTTAGFVLALVPLTIVLAGVLWLDRWEPEPKILLLVALLWGAGVSTLSSLFVNTGITQWIYDSTGDARGANMLGAVVVAPVVEEVFKGLGVLLLFLARRQHFDGPVDGVVYAATVAAGFAFTENILYFARSADLVWVVFVMRGLFSPFAHLIFTACIGIAIGMAARSRKSTAVFLAFPVGLVGAMGLHALWNGSASLGNQFLFMYVVVQVPLFISVIVLMVWLRRQEAEVIRARLGEYAQAGWFAPHEVQMLSSMRLRSQARTWAAGYGERAKAAMRKYQRDATSLAYLRQRQLTGRAELRASQSEHELLNEIQKDRHTFTVSAQGRLQ
ncbi:MAG TPA: PrsW family intramembrane metalloprotease [Actinotalea caeni]|uniref:PrsW family intramembrane metalloprotease n=1 Tax=Actinotalea caeni TaxID=1348467 RepID=UPI0012E17B75|nr:PrsW family intramembrane metalloprotease [Actinotalea caeni]HLV56813.1 PrsW family intramembrane metalloprotease [Actinotalea caeni]